jgi:hypothetical protein
MKTDYSLHVQTSSGLYMPGISCLNGYDLLIYVSAFIIVQYVLSMDCLHSSIFVLLAAL